MVSTFTANKDLEQPAHNDYVDTWDVPVNQNWEDIDTALGSSVTLNATGLSGVQVLSTAQYRPLSLLISGAPIAAITYEVPSGVGGQWIVRNATTGGFDVGIKSAAGGAIVNIPESTNLLVWTDGASNMRPSVNVPPAAAGADTTIQFNHGGTLGGSGLMTFDGTITTLRNLSVINNTILGDAAGDGLTINAATAAIPNDLDIGGGALRIGDANKNIGVGTAAIAANRITANGLIASTVSGFKFPDSSIQTTAAVTSPWSRFYGTDSSAVTFIAIQNIPGSVNDLQLMLDLSANALGAVIYMRFYAGGVLDSGAVYSWSQALNGGALSATGAAGDTFIQLGQAQSTTGALNIILTMAGIQRGKRAQCNWIGNYVASAGSVAGVWGFGHRATASAIDGIFLGVTSGTMSGRVDLWTGT
jgi:hypothetical protein